MLEWNLGLATTNAPPNASSSAGIWILVIFSFKNSAEKAVMRKGDRRLRMLTSAWLPVLVARKLANTPSTPKIDRPNMAG